jgi:hypothetical protein
MAKTELLIGRSALAYIKPRVGKEQCMTVVDPDPRLEQLRRLDNWLSHFTVWRQNLLAIPFALITAGLTVWLNLAVPVADPKVLS